MFTKSSANSIRWQTINGIVVVFTLSALVGILVVKTVKIGQFDSFHFDKNEKSPIKIGIATCAGRFNITRSVATYETLTLIKSLIVSSSLHRVNAIDLYIFVDSYELQTFLDNIITGFSFNIIGSTVTIRTHFYDVFKLMHHDRLTKFFITADKPCAFLRMFLPNVLPELDELLYLDTDTIVTGNIGEIWKKFQNMDDHKLVALAPNNEPEDDTFRDLDALSLGTIPRVPPKGVNAGVFYMNLAGLRKFGWTDKLIRIYREYTHNGRYIGDQHLINIALSEHLDILEILPCHYNFQTLHCDRGLTCKTAYDDPTGIQILHGTGDSFYKDNLSHRHFFATYTEFDLTARVDIAADLLKPLREHYLQVKNASTCDGVLGPILFKDILL